MNAASTALLIVWMGGCMITAYTLIEARATGEIGLVGSSTGDRIALVLFDICIILIWPVLAVFIMLWFLWDKRPRFGLRSKNTEELLASTEKLERVLKIRRYAE